MTRAIGIFGMQCYSLKTGQSVSVFNLVVAAYLSCGIHAAPHITANPATQLRFRSKHLVSPEIVMTL